MLKQRGGLHIDNHRLVCVASLLHQDDVHVWDGAVDRNAHRLAYDPFLKALCLTAVRIAALLVIGLCERGQRTWKALGLLREMLDK